MDAYIGVGHGRKPDCVFDPGAVSGSRVEHTRAISVVDAYADALRASGVKVKDEGHSGAGHDPNFEGSARRANELGVKYADEIHFNASGPHTGTGTEVLVDSRTSEANKRTCRAISARISQVLRIPDRGLKFARFDFLTSTRMPAAIIEVAFLDNPTDKRAIRRKDALEEVGEAIAEARCDFLGVRCKGRDPRRRGVPVARKRPSAAKRRAHAWADSKGCAEVFHKIIDAGWGNARRIGIDGAVFVAQAAKETGFGKFGGVIDASFFNSGGLKTTAGGDNSDPAAHQRFRDWNRGTRAHCAHLALYAGVVTVAQAKRLGDPRAFAEVRGVAPTVQELGGTWAPARDYGRSIVRDLLRPLRRF